MKILEVVTDEVSSIKTLIEVLKEMLTEANFEFIRSKDDTKESNDNKTKDSDDDVDVDVDVDDVEEDLDDEDLDDEDDDSSKKTKTKTKTKAKKAKDKKSKSKVKSKTKKNSDTYEDIEEELDTKDKSKDASAGTEAEKGGMRMTAVDTTKTVLINLKLYESKFTKFKCKKKKLTLGINLGSFFKFIKTIDKEDTLTLFQEHDNKHFLNIKADSADNSKDSAYELKLLELNKDKINIPAISFEAVVTINSQEFHKICREMKPITDYVEIKCLKNKIVFTFKGDIGNRSITYKTDSDGDKVNIQYSHKDNTKPFIVQGVFDLKYLVMFSKCATLCPLIEIYLKSDMPMIIKYNIAALGRLLLCLSPIKEGTIMNDKYEDDEFYSDDDIDIKK